MGSSKETEHAKHVAGGPGKSSRKGHVEADPERAGNKPSQLQTEHHRGPGKGGAPGQRTERRRAPS
jgi:hypothetical protein